MSWCCYMYKLLKSLVNSYLFDACVLRWLRNSENATLSFSRARSCITLHSKTEVQLFCFRRVESQHIHWLFFQYRFGARLSTCVLIMAIWRGVISVKYWLTKRNTSVHTQLSRHPYMTTRMPNYKEFNVLQLDSKHNVTFTSLEYIVL